MDLWKHAVAEVQQLAGCVDVFDRHDFIEKAARFLVAKNNNTGSSQMILCAAPYTDGKYDTVTSGRKTQTKVFPGAASQMECMCDPSLVYRPMIVDGCGVVTDLLKVANVPMDQLYRDAQGIKYPCFPYDVCWQRGCDHIVVVCAGVYATPRTPADSYYIVSSNEHCLLLMAAINMVLANDGPAVLEDTLVPMGPQDLMHYPGSQEYFSVLRDSVPVDFGFGWLNPKDLPGLRGAALKIYSTYAAGPKGLAYPYFPFGERCSMNFCVELLKSVFFN